MELLVLGVFIWFLLRLFEKRKQLTRARKDYVRLVEDAAADLSVQQAAYEADVKSRSVLEGDGSYSFEVDLTRAVRDDLESIYAYLDLKGLKREPLTTVLKPEGTGSASKVAVELSQAPLGTVQGEAGELLSSLVRRVGGRASCAGRLKKDKAGAFRFFLDVKFEGDGSHGRNAR